LGGTWLSKGYMLKKLEQKSTRWSFVVNAIDIIVVIALVSIGSLFMIRDKDIVTKDIVAIASLIISIAIAYITTIRPFFRKPRLEMFIDEIRCSAPILQGDTASWFIRFGIMNCGLTMAKGCIGRIVGVWTEQGEQLKKFDPLTLFWARQDIKHTGFSPVNIQGYGDVEYLDIAQIKKSESTPLALRMAYSLSLTKGVDDSHSPGSEAMLRAGTHYIKVAIYADEANISPRWFEITCSENVPECDGSAPCQIKEKRPKFAR